MDGKLLARIGAIAFVAIALTATAIEMTRQEETPAPARAMRPAAPAEDPLVGELRRCQALGAAGAADAPCLRAWAENRRRFLAPGARPAARIADPDAPAPDGTELLPTPAPGDTVR